MYFQTQKSMMQ